MTYLRDTLAAIAILAILPATIPARAQSSQTLPLTTITETSMAVEMRANFPRAAGLDPALHARIQTLIDAGLGEMRDMAGEDYRESGQEDFWRAYSLSLNWGEYFVSPRFVSLLETSYVYSGGAHGNSGFQSLLWDLRAGRQVSLGEIFTDARNGAPVMRAIAAHLRRELVRQKIELMNIDKEDARTDPGLEELRATRDTLEVFTLTPSDVAGKSGGLVFHFAPYLLGSYAEGSYHLAVPVSVFEKYLSPEFTDVFGGKPIQFETLSNYLAPGVNILLRSPLSGNNLSSPLELSGEAPDFWFEHGEARVEVRDSDEKPIGAGVIAALPDALASGAASGMVRFKGDITFEAPEEGSYGRIVFWRGAGEEGESDRMKIDWWVSF